MLLVSDGGRDSELPTYLSLGKDEIGHLVRVQRSVA